VGVMQVFVFVKNNKKSSCSTIEQLDNIKDIKNTNKLTSKNKKYIIVFLVCFGYAALVNNYYRPFVYSSKFNDFGFADIGNNITFIPGVYSLMRLCRQKYIISKNIEILFYFVILSLVEVLSAFIPNIGTFDPKDILGLLIGAVLLFFFIKNDK
jgi:hypothetical protein